MIVGTILVVIVILMVWRFLKKAHEEEQEQEIQRKALEIEKDFEKKNLEIEKDHEDFSIEMKEKYGIDLTKRYYYATVPTRPTTFVAIDFETATGSRMACALGVVAVERGKIVYEREFRFRPPGNKYDPMNTYIHGITPDMTENCPSFAESWPEIKPLLEGHVVTAHYLSFDFDVLRKNLLFYNLPLISFKSKFCTCKDLGNASLENACRHFGIEIGQHHNALDDARACAKLALAYREFSGLDVEIERVMP